MTFFPSTTSFSAPTSQLSNERAHVRASLQRLNEIYSEIRSETLTSDQFKAAKISLKELADEFRSADPASFPAKKEKAATLLVIERIEQELSNKNPNAWKTAFAGRAAIAAGVAYLYGPVIGVTATVLAYGVEKSLQWVQSKTNKLFQTYVSGSSKNGIETPPEAPAIPKKPPEAPTATAPSKTPPEAPAVPKKPPEAPTATAPSKTPPEAPAATATSKPLKVQASQTSEDEDLKIPSKMRGSSAVSFEKPGYVGNPKHLVSIGIPNKGNTCFIASGLQVNFIDNPVLENALVEEAEIGGDTKEIGKFIQAYHQDQTAEKHSYCSTGNVGSIRTALWRLTGDDRFLIGQHDPQEMRFWILNDPALTNRLKKAGFYGSQTVRRYYDTKGLTPIDGGCLKLDRERGMYYSSAKAVDIGDVVVNFPPDYDRAMPLKSLLIASLQGHVEMDPKEYPSHQMEDRSWQQCAPLFFERKWDHAPEEITVWVARFGDSVLAPKDERPIAVSERVALPGTCFKDRQERNYELVGIIEHIGKSKRGGHYVSYKKENGKYYQYDDRLREEISEKVFLEKASGAYGLKFAKR